MQVKKKLQFWLYWPLFCTAVVKRAIYCIRFNSNAAKGNCELALSFSGNVQSTAKMQVLHGKTATNKCQSLSLLLSALFREFGGARCVHNIVKYRQCREHALLIIQQLVLSPSGDDDMGTLLGLMHSAPSTELQLKTDVLRVRTHAHTHSEVTFSFCNCSSKHIIYWKL